MPQTILTPVQLRAITWRMALGHGGVTRVAGWTRYSPQQISHILLGRKDNPTVMAYVCGMIGQPWPVAVGLLDADVPDTVRVWWDGHARRVFEAGRNAQPIDGPVAHAEFVAVLRETTTRFRQAHVVDGRPAQTRKRTTRRAKTLLPPGAAGGPHRREQGTSSGDTNEGNGPRVTCTEEPMRSAHAPQGSAAALQERIG